MCRAEQLKEKLHAIPEYRDREIVIVRMAQSAYKQPQGLFALNYYMLLGGEFDIVINLDGLNELTMSLSQNYPLQVALDYPQGWNMRTGEIVPADESDIAMELTQIRGQRRKYALSGVNSYWQWLPSQFLLWHVRDERLREQLVTLQGRTLKVLQRVGVFIRCGPAPLAQDETAAWRSVFRVWKQASLQMHRICQASGILYFHAIQPNQYDPGSKPLTTSEVDLMSPDSVGNQSQPFLTIIPVGYPLLRRPPRTAICRSAGDGPDCHLFEGDRPAVCRLLLPRQSDGSEMLAARLETSFASRAGSVDLSSKQHEGSRLRSLVKSSAGSFRLRQGAPAPQLRNCSPHRCKSVRSTNGDPSSQEAATRPNTLPGSSWTRKVLAPMPGKQVIRLDSRQGRGRRAPPKATSRSARRCALRARFAAVNGPAGD